MGSIPRISPRIVKFLDVAIALFLFAAICAPLSARAQTPGKMSGSVYDQTGGVLTGVRVRVRGPTEQEMQTAADGSFVFPALPEGDYEVIAELTGFESAHRTVRVRSAERTTISFTMQLAIVE